MDGYIIYQGQAKIKTTAWEEQADNKASIQHPPITTTTTQKTAMNVERPCQNLPQQDTENAQE